MTPNDLRQLPCYHRLTIPYSYLDGMGHMNIQYYLAMGSDSATTMLNRFGMTPSYMLNERGGVFLLAQAHALLGRNSCRARDSGLHAAHRP